MYGVSPYVSSFFLQKMVLVNCVSLKLLVDILQKLTSQDGGL